MVVQCVLCAVESAYSFGHLYHFRYVVFVSGLNVGSAHCNQLALQLMVDYLSGCLGGVEDQAKMRKVVRVIVAGNSITNKPVESSIQVEKKKKKVRKCTFTNVCVEEILACGTIHCLMCLEMHSFSHLQMCTPTPTHHPYTPTPTNTHTPHTHTHNIEPFPIQYMSRNYEAHGVEAMKELDTLMAQLAVSSPLTHTHTVYHLGDPRGPV